MNEPLIPGKRYRVTFEGTANEYGALRFDRVPGDRVSRGVPVSAIRNNATAIEQLPDPTPVWKPGDVVVVRFHPTGTAYTYVRGLSGWPGEYARAKRDDEISELWREGKATPVLQSGGVPFDESRLPKSPSDEALDELRERLTRPAPRRPIDDYTLRRPAPRPGNRRY